MAGRRPMNTLRQAVNDYLELRRGLGFKLVKYEACLREFVSFLEQKKASHITTALAVQFGMLYPQQRPKTQARRYSVVRGFAGYRIGVDPATKIPPCGLVRGGTRRARPYLYSDQEIYQLLEAARNLPSTYSLRPWTYYCLFRLVAVTGLRLGEALNLQCQSSRAEPGSIMPGLRLHSALFKRLHQNPPTLILCT